MDETISNLEALKVTIADCIKDKSDTLDLDKLKEYMKNEWTYNMEQEKKLEVEGIIDRTKYPDNLKEYFDKMIDLHGEHMEEIITERYKEKVQKLPHKHYFNESGLGGKNISIYDGDNVTEYITAAMNSDAGPGSGNIPYPSPNNSVNIDHDKCVKFGFPHINSWKTTTKPSQDVDGYGFIWEIVFNSEPHIKHTWETHHYQTRAKNQQYKKIILTSGIEEVMPNLDDPIGQMEGGKNGLITTIKEKDAAILDYETNKKKAGDVNDKYFSDGFFNNYITRKSLGDHGQLWTYLDYCENQVLNHQEQQLKDSMFLTCDKTVFYRTVENEKACCLTGIRDVNERDKKLGKLYIPSSDPIDKIKKHKIITEQTVKNYMKELKLILQRYKDNPTLKCCLSTLRRGKPYLRWSSTPTDFNGINAYKTGLQAIIDELEENMDEFNRKINEMFTIFKDEVNKLTSTETDAATIHILDCAKQFQELKTRYMFPPIITPYKVGSNIIILKEINTTTLYPPTLYPNGDFRKTIIDEIYKCFFPSNFSLRGGGKKYKTKTIKKTIKKKKSTSTPLLKNRNNKLKYSKKMILGNKPFVINPNFSTEKIMEIALKSTNPNIEKAVLEWLKNRKSDNIWLNDVRQQREIFYNMLADSAHETKCSHVERELYKASKSLYKKDEEELNDANKEEGIDEEELNDANQEGIVEEELKDACVYAHYCLIIYFLEQNAAKFNIDMYNNLSKKDKEDNMNEDMNKDSGTSIDFTIVEAYNFSNFKLSDPPKPSDLPKLFETLGFERFGGSVKKRTFKQKKKRKNNKTKKKKNKANK